jgi:hypothetical protein
MEAECIGRMIEDFRRVVQVLDCDVSSKEERSQICDLSDPCYLILARQLAARRDNLKATIAALEARRSSIAPLSPTELARGSSHTETRSVLSSPQASS